MLSEIYILTKLCHLQLGGPLITGIPHCVVVVVVVGVVVVVVVAVDYNVAMTQVYQAAVHSRTWLSSSSKLVRNKECKNRTNQLRLFKDTSSKVASCFFGSPSI